MFCAHKNSYLQLVCAVNPRVINKAVDQAMEKRHFDPRTGLYAVYLKVRYPKRVLHTLSHNSTFYGWIYLPISMEISPLVTKDFGPIKFFWNL